MILKESYKWNKKMIALHPEYIIDQSEHKKAVVLPFNEWETLMSDIEELEDIRAFDAAKSNNLLNRL